MQATQSTKALASRSEHKERTKKVRKNTGLNINIDGSKLSVSDEMMLCIRSSAANLGLREAVQWCRSTTFCSLPVGLVSSPTCMPHQGLPDLIQLI